MQADAASVLQLGAQHGFNAVLVVVLLVGHWRLQQQLGARLEALRDVVAEMVHELRELRREIEPPRRTRGG